MNRAVRTLKNAIGRGRVQGSRREGVDRPLFMTFSTDDQMLFAKRLSMILRSGTPIMEGLHLLHDEGHSRSSAHIYRSLVADVAKGQTLSHGLKKFEKYFGEFSINVIRIGESSGTLHENLDYLAQELKKKKLLRRKVVSALVYPAIIVMATVGIVALLTVYIFPKILPIFQSVEAALPLSTRILIAISAFFIEWGIALMVGAVGACILVALLMRNKSVHRLFDVFVLRVPLIGRLVRYYNLANISRTLSILLRSDVRIVEAMELTARSCANLAYKEALFETRDSIMRGQTVSSQLRHNTTLFPALLPQMLVVAERTGNLSGTFAYISAMYEEEIDDLTKNLTTLLEPILMIIMGIVVGFVAISIITPIYTITQTLTPR